MARRRKHWGWGFEDQQPGIKTVADAAAGVKDLLGFDVGEPEAPVELDAIELPAPRIELPAAVSEFSSQDRHDRVFHAHGAAYRDVVRALRGQIERPPDAVAYPSSERQIEQLLEWASGANVAVIPFGGGTSVVGGVEPLVGDHFNGVVTLDMARVSGVAEIDERSLAARIRGGTFGPELERLLEPHGLTLRHFPQSFEFSTLGGWIVTRAGGHFATRLTHIDDLVESIRAVTPTGLWQSRRLPASGAGPSPDRIMLGSEGSLGVVTEAWVRVRRRPQSRAGGTARFKEWNAALDCVRTLVQDDLTPANCRLIEADEAALTGAGDGTSHLLIVGFEAAERPVEAELARARQLIERAGGEFTSAAASKEGDAGAWRQTFLQAPYLRDMLVQLGVVAETFETAITWDRAEDMIAEVKRRIYRAVGDVCGCEAKVMCRLTHVYPDGAAPYFTVMIPGQRGQEIACWDQVKKVASDSLYNLGATITHHHAVGRHHMPTYRRQTPEPFQRGVAALKASLDPAGVMNPGVIVAAPGEPIGR